MGYVSDNFVNDSIQRLIYQAKFQSFLQRKLEKYRVVCRPLRFEFDYTRNYYLFFFIMKSFDEIIGVKIYTKFDIWAAYNLVRMRAGDE